MKLPLSSRRARLVPVPLGNTPKRYMVTVKTKNGEMLFASRDDRGTRLSIEGEVARLCWCLLPTRFTSLHLDAFTILPDRVCGIFEFPFASTESTAVILRSYKLSVARRIAQIRESSLGSPWEESFEVLPILTEEELQRMRLSILQTI